MQTSKEIKGNLVGHKGIGGRNDGNPYGARNEDQPFTVDVGYAAPEQEEAAEGEGVGGHDPLEAGLWNGQGATYCREDNDDRLQRQRLLEGQRAKLGGPGAGVELR